MRSRTKIVAFAFGLALGGLLFAILPAGAAFSVLHSRDSWVTADNDIDFLPSYPNAALAAALGVGGRVTTAELPFTIRAVSFRVTVAGGGGGGTTVVTVTDGTNTCTATLLCTTSAVIGTYRVATAAGAGRGCKYGRGVALTASVTTAGCTTTQPTVSSLIVMGRWDSSEGEQ